MLDRVTIGRMRAWTADKPILVALSGGGDSVALLHVLVVELGADRLRAAIVDHALRDGSAHDAARAKDLSQALGVSATVLTLSWPEGASRAQRAAREARYRALCEHARAAGLDTIAAAHTADDQAETVLMRAAAGSTWRGLAGIAPFAFAPVWPEGRGITLARPLLGARRAALREDLHVRGASWIEDPANSNPVFERIRVRERLQAIEHGGFDPMRLVQLAARLRRRAERLDRAALELIMRAARLGYEIHVAEAAWRGPAEVRRRALSVLIAAAGGAAREPPASEMHALEQRVMGRRRRSGTHSGVAFAPRDGGVVLRRDPGAVLGRADGSAPLAPLTLTKGVETIWDGRLSITAPEPGWRVVPAPNRELVAFESGLGLKRYAEVSAHLRLRPLALERVAHAFAPDINRPKP